MNVLQNLKYQIYDKSSYESRVFPCEQTDKHSELDTRFCNFAIAPKNIKYIVTNWAKSVKET